MINIKHAFLQLLSFKQKKDTQHLTREKIYFAMKKKSV